MIGQDADDPDAVTLSRVFVPLRAYVELNKKNLEDISAGRSLSNATAGIEDVSHAEKRKVVDLFEILRQWIEKKERWDAIRIVSGGPGIGKSSSIRAVAATIARARSAYPVLIPLQKLQKPNEPLRDRIRDYLINTKEIPFSKSPFDKEAAQPTFLPILLIFDGLDELVRPGKDADEIAREFMVDLRGLLEEENGLTKPTAARVLAIVTGRIAAAGSAARALKCSGEQILHLMRFSEVNLRNEKERQEELKKLYDDPSTLLPEDQRLTWWRLWRTASADVPDDIPDILLHDDLFDVTVEPLLLYFIALIRPWKMPAPELNRNSLYAQLLNHFYQRECDKGDLNFATEFESFEHYEIVLQAMALAAWYDGSTRIGTIDVIENLLKAWDPAIAAAFSRLIGANKPAIGAALAFYMKPGERPNSFEFLHKTFAEYLVARRVVEFVRIIAEDLNPSVAKRRRAPNVSATLQEWCQLMGPRALDRDIFNFLADEVMQQYRSDKAVLSSWRGALVLCLKTSLQFGMPSHLAIPFSNDELRRRSQTLRDIEDQARNAEEALLACLNSTIVPTLDEPDFQPIEVRLEGSRTDVNRMLNRIRGNRIEDFIALRLLSGLNLSREALYVHDLFGCIAERTDFSGASMLYANFVLGRLRGASFKNASCSNVCLEDAVAEFADFSGANLSETVFKKAKCTNAKFVGAFLRSSDFSEAELLDVDFEGAFLEECNFAGSDISGANFSGANLKNANFANLRSAKNAVFESSSLDKKSRATLTKLGAIIN